MSGDACTWGAVWNRQAIAVSTHAETGSARSRLNTGERWRGQGPTGLPCNLHGPGGDFMAVGQTSWAWHTSWREWAKVRYSNSASRKIAPGLPCAPPVSSYCSRLTHRRALDGLSLSTSRWQWSGNFFWPRSHSGSMFAVIVACDKAQALL